MSRILLILVAGLVVWNLYLTSVLRKEVWAISWEQQIDIVRHAKVREAQTRELQETIIRQAKIREEEARR